MVYYQQIETKPELFKGRLLGIYWSMVFYTEEDTPCHYLDVLNQKRLRDDEGGT